MTDKSKGKHEKPAEISEDDLENVTGGGSLAGGDTTSETQVIILQPSDLSSNGYETMQVEPIETFSRVTPIKPAAQVTPVKERK